MTLPPVLEPLVRAPNEFVMVTDFDGTLAPINDDPVQVRALPASLDALHALTDHLAAVAVVSGRPVDFLQHHVPVRGVALFGQYGLERVSAQGRVEVDHRAAPFLAAIAAAVLEAEARWPQLQIERKEGLAFTLHWRAVSGVVPNFEEFRSLADRHGLVALPARMAAELRTPVPVDKGTVLDGLLAERGGGAFIGDDEGDLRAFDALDRYQARHPGSPGVRIAVRSSESPPALLDRADLVVDGAPGVAELLSALVRALSEQP